MSASAATRDWPEAPWGDALLRMLADAAADAGPSSLPSWPGTAAEAEAALADPALRGALGRCLAPLAEADVGAVVLAMRDRPAARLALAPAPALLDAVAFGAAWIAAPSLAMLVRRAEVEAARAALGERAWSFAFGRCRMLPRPAATLLGALGGEATDDMLRPGARLLGLALGALPEPVLARFRLRRPHAVWNEVAGACRESPEGGAALSALHRLFREEAPAWLSWSR